MIWIYIFGILAFIGLSSVIFEIIYNAHNVPWNQISWLSTIGWCCLVIGLGVIVGLGAIIININQGEDLKYENAKVNYEMILYAIENDSETTPLEEINLLTAIRLHNEAIREARYYKNNIWVKDFIYTKLADLPYIEYEGVIYN